MHAVEVFADVTCPFAHVGLRRFAEERVRHDRDDVLLHVRAWPLELVNGRGPDPGHIAEVVAALQATVAPDLFAGFRPEAFPRGSLRALELEADAYRHHPDLGERVALRLRDELFESGRDVSHADVLAEVAHEHGLRPPRGDLSFVMADWEEGRRRGVAGSPHFFVGGCGFFCPALAIDRSAHGLGVQRDESRFEEFMRRAFGPHDLQPC